MKATIGPFIDWLGPYQIAKKLMFWIPEYDKNFETSKTVHNFGTWLAEDNNGNPSYLARFCEWVHSKRKRKIKIKVHKYDTWNMDGTLSYIIVPMLKQLRDTKHGTPATADEDVPAGLGLRESEKIRSADMSEFEVWELAYSAARWDWILNEMIWAFEQHNPDLDWEQQYRKGNIDIKWNKLPDGSFSMDDGPNNTYECDYDGIRAHHERMQRGTILFGKYYANLWD